MKEQGESVPSNVWYHLWVLRIVVLDNILNGGLVNGESKKVSEYKLSYFACFLFKYFSFEYWVLFSNCWLFWVSIWMIVSPSAFFFNSSISYCSKSWVASSVYIYLLSLTGKSEPASSSLSPSFFSITLRFPSLSTSNVVKYSCFRSCWRSMGVFLHLNFLSN